MQRKILALALVGGLAALTAGPSMAATKKTTKKKATATKATTKPVAATAAPTTAAPTTAAPSAAKTTSKKGGTLVDGRNFASGDPTTAGDPALASVVNEGQIAGMLFDGLMEIDYTTAELKPNVAESFALNAAGDEVLFKIRKGVKFSNGEDVLPSSFKCAWERVVNPATAATLGYHFDNIVGKVAVDQGKTKDMSGVVADDAAMTLKVSLTTPYADFVAETQHTVFSPMTKDGCKAGRSYHDGIMIGNGPFKMAEPWKRGQFIKLVRNDSYFGGIAGHTAYLDGIEFKIIKDEVAALNVFESGGSDVSVIPSGRFTELTKKYGDRAAKTPQLGVNYIGFNWEDKKWGGFDNAKLRQAVSLAVNRKQINDAIFDGSRKEATGFTPIGIPGVKADAYGLNATPDLVKARALLKEWGKEVPTLKMRVANTPANINIAAIIRNNLKEIGVDVDIDPDLPTGYFDRLKENPGQAFRAGWAADFVGYDNFMYPLLHSKSIGGDNRSRFGLKTVDDLINQGRQTSDANKRNALYQQAESVVMEQAIVVPLYWSKWSNLLSKNVDAFVQGPTAFVDYNEVSMK